jgi:AraC-like DNA-binding protein
MTGRMPVPHNTAPDPQAPIRVFSSLREAMRPKISTQGVNSQPGSFYLWNGQALLVGSVNETRSHRHHAVQLVVSLSGSFYILAEGFKSRQRAVLISPDTRHRLNGRDGRQAILLIDSESSAARMLVSRYGKVNRLSVLDAEILAPSVARFSSVGAEDLSCSEARIICDEMIQALTGAAHVPVAMDQRIRKAIELARELPEHKAHLVYLAKEVGLSESRFAHLFSEETGIPIRRYLLWLRLMQAIQCLLNGVSLTTAAHEAGFADSAHLSRTFRDMFGMTLSDCFKNSRFVQVISCFG